MSTETIDITQEGSGFEANKGIGPLLRYHGATVDIRAITRARAEEMAKDPQVRYIRFAPVKPKEVRRAILEAMPTDTADIRADIAAPDVAKAPAPSLPPSPEKGLGRKHGKK